MTYIFIETVFVGTVDESPTGVDAWGVETGGVDRNWPGIRNGRDPAGGVPPEPIIGGADAGGNSPRILRAAIRGFSAGWGVLLAGGSWGIEERILEIWGGIWGGGVGCCLTAVALRSSAMVSEFRIEGND